jgi:hypothetical protein
VSHIEIEKQDIFNYGVFHYEVPPDKIGENEFEYLESKIPSYYGLYSDHLDLTVDKIVCKVSGEAAQRLSEIVGIGVGLKSALDIFNLRKKDIGKIKASKKREKRLDFNVKIPSGHIDIETKGTVVASNVAGMISDVHSKKIGKPTGVNRYGFVTLLRKAEHTDRSIIYVTDPESDEKPINLRGIYVHIAHYLAYLRFALDNPGYNRLARIVLKGSKYKKPPIKFEKIKYSLDYSGKTYLGKCFDKRLIVENISEFRSVSKSIDGLFRSLTKFVGKEKYFLGIDSEILEAINKKDISFLEEYDSKDQYSVSDGVEYIHMSDGVLFIKSLNGALPKMDEIFPEEDVKSRLQLIARFNNHEPKECGAPCRSRDIEGKPCEIMTYRGNCHFHR